MNDTTIKVVVETPPAKREQLRYLLPMTAFRIVEGVDQPELFIYVGDGNLVRQRKGGWQVFPAKDLCGLGDKVWDMEVIVLDATLVIKGAQQ